MKDKNNHVIISTGKEKTCNKVQHPFMIKNSFNKLRIERNYLNIIKAIYEKPRANIILNGEKSKAPPLKSGAKQ